MATHTWSDEQKAIFGWFATGEGNLVVRARAGTGKTTSLLEAINHAPERRILLAAFNKQIAEELQQRLRNPRAEAKTLHALGFSYVRAAWPGVKVDNRRKWTLAKAVVPSAAPQAVVRAVAELHTRAREIAPHMATEGAAALDAMMELAITFELQLRDDDGDLDDRWTDEGVAGWALDAMSRAMERSDTIDFSDMIFLPLVHKWVTPRYELVVIDECFVGDTPVLLADGRSVRIRELVEGRVRADVLSYDTRTRTTVAAPITGWHKVLKRKPTWRVIVQQIVPRADGQPRTASSSRPLVGRRTLVVTEDQEFYLPSRGWVAARALQVGDRGLLEDTAPRDSLCNNRYKHSARGKRQLAKSITARQHTFLRGRGNHAGPPVRGGNGRGLTAPQQLLLEELGADWTAEYIVSTGSRQRGGPPTHYKLDLANPHCKLAIELDGESHRALLRKAADKRKDRHLRQLGWTVLRYPNRAAFERTAEILAAVARKAGCVRDFEVISVEPYEVADHYVYDLTVKGTHCFFAHGALVHNCQDMSNAQLELAQRACIRGGRIAIIGDDRQAIYGFRGADAGSIDRLKGTLQAYELGLKTTYRCPRAVVELAQQIVPDFVAAPTAPPGIIMPYNDAKDTLVRLASAGDFVLSRTNAPLVGLCLALLKAGKVARIRGRDLSLGLRKLCEGIQRKGAKDMDGLRAGLDDHLARESAALEKRVQRGELTQDVADQHLERAGDHRAVILALTDGLVSFEELFTRFDTLFTGDETAGSVVMFSTVHRAKGLESERVWLLTKTFLATKRDKIGNPDQKWRRGLEEENIRYVAITRSKHTLCWLNGDLE